MSILYKDDCVYIYITDNYTTETYGAKNPLARMPLYGCRRAAFGVAVTWRNTWTRSLRFIFIMAGNVADLRAPRN